MRLENLLDPSAACCWLVSTHPSLNSQGETLKEDQDLKWLAKGKIGALNLRRFHKELQEPGRFCLLGSECG